MVVTLTLQDIQSMGDDGQYLSKEDVTAMVAIARGCLLQFKEKITVGT